MRRRLTGRLRVALPPAEAFRLFTPLGEREWAEGWDPEFPDPDPGDDSAPGTVFRTLGHGETVWTVVGREDGRHVSYARVTHGVNAGLVSVTLDDAADAGSRVTVTYELTALTGEAENDLRAFADGYPAYIRSWEEAIGTALTARTAGA